MDFVPHEVLRSTLFEHCHSIISFQKQSQSHMLAYPQSPLSTVFILTCVPTADMLACIILLVQISVLILQWCHKTKRSDVGVKSSHLTVGSS